MATDWIAGTDARLDFADRAFTTIAASGGATAFHARPRTPSNRASKSPAGNSGEHDEDPVRGAQPQAAPRDVGRLAGEPHVTVLRPGARESEDGQLVGDDRFESEGGGGEQVVAHPVPVDSIVKGTSNLAAARERGAGRAILVAEDTMKGLRALSIVLLAALTLAGCGAARGKAEAGGGAFLSETVAAAPASPERSADKAGADANVAADTAFPAARMVIKTAALSVRVKDVAGANTRAIQLAEGSGGFVQSSSQWDDGGVRADLSLRVPPEGFLPLIHSLETLGKVEGKSISGEDVTEEYYDLDARLENLGEVRSRLFELLDRAAKVTDAIEVEQQLERVGAEINQIKGRMKYLQNMTGMATINLSLYTDEKPAAEPFINWAMIGGGFVTAARWLVQALFFILQALVVLIPLAAIFGAAAFAVVRLVRFARARRAPAKTQKRS